MNLNKLKKLSGDASLRNFYRGKNSIFIYCIKNKKSNLLYYDAINKILIKNKVIAPSLISQNYIANYLEIEDFGDLTVFKKFKQDFEILSVLRNFKIIGIFTRLSVRDKKHKYLKLIPYAWQMINNRSANNPKFKDLNSLINKYFEKKKH